MFYNHIYNEDFALGILYFIYMYSIFYKIKRRIGSYVDIDRPWGGGLCFQNNGISLLLSYRLHVNTTGQGHRFDVVLVISAVWTWVSVRVRLEREPLS